MVRKTGEFARRNAIALVALFVALGGTSYAAFGVPNNSVGGLQLRNGAISSQKLTVGNKNWLRAGLGAPAAAIIGRPVLASPGSQTVTPNSGQGSQLSGNNTSFNQPGGSSALAYGVTTVTVPSACTSASVDAYVGDLIVASAKVTGGNSGNPQTVGLAPQAAINGSGAQNVVLRAVNGCAGNMTVSALNLTIAAFK
jgi:hypothetical protein